ncbi:flagellar hook assembly protein FlgD [Caldifermentibacillus hisashii]|uniref:Basal-body rod modification protein FlgD n=1 Tax=Caldifermentibacillus hisashii TaxID=996558 RepID=A0ABU9JYU8_9BACI
MTNTIDSSYYLSNAKQSSTNNNTLGKDAFLKLLVTQLQNQDPLNPMEDREFIAQMATFSQLEQMITMNQSMEELLSDQKQQQMLSYQSLLGMEVKWDKITYPSDEKAEPIIENGTGIITSIKFTEDGVKLYLEDGTELTPSNISGVSVQNKGNQFTEASNLIGKKVSWEEKGELKYAIVQAVSQKDGQIFYQVNDQKGTKLTIDQILSIMVA